MKKLILFFTLLFCCWGCEEDNTNNTPGSIIGTWKVENQSGTRYSGYTVFGTETITDTVDDDGLTEDMEKYYTFGNDNTVTTRLYESGFLEYVEIDYYTLYEDVLTVDQNQIYTILELTNTSLEYDKLYEYSWDGPGDTTKFERIVEIGRWYPSSIPDWYPLTE